MLQLQPDVREVCRIMQHSQQLLQHSEELKSWRGELERGVFTKHSLQWVPGVTSSGVNVWTQGTGHSNAALHIKLLGCSKLKLPTELCEKLQCSD